MSTVPRNKLLGVVLTLPLLATVGCAVGSDGGSGGDAGSIEARTISFATINSKSDPPVQGILAMQESITEASDGKITFENYWNGTLATGAEELSAVGEGLADMGRIVVSYTPQELPVSTYILDLASGFDTSYPVGYLQASAVTQNIYTSKAVQEEFAKQNLKILAARTTGEYNFICTTPVREPADAAGLRIRTSTEAQVAQVEALGMVPVSVDYAEIFEALQRGVIDCTSLAPYTAMGAGVFDVAKHFTPVSLTPLAGTVVVMNNDAWERLSTAAQEVFLDGAAKYLEEDINMLLGQYSKFATEMPKQGVEFYNADALNEVVAEVRADQLAQAKEQPPSALANPDTFIKEFDSMLAKWKTVAADAVSSSVDVQAPIAERYKATAEADLGTYYEQLHASLGAK